MARYVPVDLKRSKYRILGLIGQGQFGRVFCASHRKTGRLVALKNLEHQRFPTHQFLRELRFLLSLQHPNIVTCQALEHTRTGRYLVMDYCEGGTLRSLIEHEGWLTLRQGLELMVNVLSGLAHAHDRGIVHCDIKPENILLTVQPQGWVARISDFGIARLSQEFALSSGASGSPAYMSPERFYGQYSPTSDIYAVGIMLFEMLVGKRPFSGVPGDLMAAHLNQPVNIPDVVPIALRPIITKALQKLSARRFASAREMLAAIEGVLNSQEWLKDLNLQQQSLPLLSEEEMLPVSAFASQAQHDLPAPVDQLLVWSEPALSYPALRTDSQQTWLGRRVQDTTGYQLEIHQYDSIGASDRTVTESDIRTIPLPTVVRELLICRQHCFAIGQRAIHWLPNLASTQLADPKTNLFVQPLIELDTDFIADLAPHGCWLSTVTTSFDQSQSQLTIWRCAKQLQTEDLETELPVAKACRVSATALCQAKQPKQVVILDARHLIVVSDIPGYTTQQLLAEPDTCLLSDDLTGSTRLEVFSRRGTPLGQWILPIRVTRLIKSHRPYRLVTLDSLNPQSILLLDLKPFRILRIQLNFQPKRVVPTQWGYILLSSQGQLLCLDESGQSIGRIDPPPELITQPDSHITAVTSFQKTDLVLATWNQAKNQGQLHVLDLSQLGLDMVF